MTAGKVLEVDTDSNSRSIWRHNNLYVIAELNEAGDLTLHGQDLSGRLWTEYEYALTVRHDDVGTLIRALGGTAGDDVLDLLQANAETLVKTGEQSWLETHSVPTESRSRTEPR